MKILSNIKQSTSKQYEPSSQSKALPNEQGRSLCSELLDWDKNLIPSLADLCVAVIVKNFEKRPLLDQLPCVQYYQVIDTIPTTLPLSLTIPLIKEESYWQRAYKEKFGFLIEVPMSGSTWKSLYLERQIRDILETAEPEHRDEEEMSEVLNLISPYVRRLTLSRLRAWEVPRTWDEDERPARKPAGHISLVPILKVLGDVEEIDISYGMDCVAERFEFRLFEISRKDIHNLGKAVLSLRKLRSLRLHRSFLTCAHTQILMTYLIKAGNLTNLDLSHCQIGDHGAKCIGYFLLQHPVIERLNLTNNRIKDEGIRSLACALKETVCPLQSLCLRLVSIKLEGFKFLCSSLVRGATITHLDISACGLDDECGERFGMALQYNSTLTSVDLSSNRLANLSAESMLTNIKLNETLTELRLFDLPAFPVEYHTRILKKVEMNRAVSKGEATWVELESRLSELDIPSTEPEVVAAEGSAGSAEIPSQPDSSQPDSSQPDSSQPPSSLPASSLQVTNMPSGSTQDLTEKETEQ